MFEKFGELLYQAHACRIEELEKKKLYRATHTQEERREKWARVIYEVGILDDGDKLSASVICSSIWGCPVATCYVTRILQKARVAPILGYCPDTYPVMDVLGYTEIAQHLILKR